MSHSSLLVLSVALIAPVGALSLANSAPVTAVVEEKMAEGTIKSVDASKNEFVLSHGVGGDKKDTTVKVTAATKYTLDGKDSTMAEALKVGNIAKVTHTDGTATRVDAKSLKKPG